MARNINVTVTSENDGTTRDAVPDWLVHFSISWIDNNGQSQSDTRDEYFLLLVNWLRVNHPAQAKRLLEHLAIAIARVQAGLDSRIEL